VSAAAAGGPIAINAGQLLIDQQSRIFSETYGASQGGAILIGAADLLVGGFGKIESATMTGSSGNGGAITIAADRIQLVNAVITSLARASGNAGAMTVQAQTIDISAGGISSATFAGGNAGAIYVTAANSLTVAGFGGVESVSTQSATGSGGAIAVQADRVSLANGAFIDGSSTGAGRGGEIRIAAARLDMTGGAHVSAASTGSGAAGSILLDVGEIDLIASDINAASVAGTGAAGTIRVRGNRLALAADSAVQSASVGGGAGGSIDIAVGDVLVDGSNIQSFTLGAARAGDIVIAADTLAVTNGAAVTSFSAGAGDAGAIRLAADSVTIASGSTVATSSAGTGAGGAIDIAGDRITIDSAIVQAGSGFSVQTLPDGSIRLIPGAGNAGPGGPIRISGGDVALANRGIVTTDTFGGGRAGDISFTADSLGLDNQSGITASTSGSGRAGLIRLVVEALDIRGGSGVLSITNAGGDAGGIIVDAADRVSLDRGIISSNASPGSTGASGSVTVEAPLVALRDGSGLLTDSGNVRAAGFILVRADDLLIDGRSSIASTNQSGNGGAAGEIRIEAERVSLTEGGQVLTDSATGAAGDIEILMPSTGVLRLESRGALTGISTSSGPGTGGRITIASPYLILSNGGVILALGEQGGANVQISSDFFVRSSDRINLVSVDGSLVLDSQIGDPSTGTEAQDVSFLDASSVLRGQCAGIRSGATSAFTSRVTGPYAPIAPAPVEDGGAGSPAAAQTTAGSCS
jgi:large exoprotein involved in heme utilization and adhesion